MKKNILALEFKDAEETDPAAIVSKALADFQKAFDDRLKSIETKSADDAKLKARIDQLEAKLNRPGTETKGDNDNDAKLVTKAFSSYIRNGREAMDQLEVKTLTVANDSGAGYLAPAELSTEMIRLLTQFSPVRAAARVGQTGAPSVILGKRTGITNAKWEGEVEDAEESEPAFGQLEIPVFGMRTYTDISQQLLEDSVQNVEAELNLALSEDFGKKEGVAFLNGTGNKQPRGIMIHPDVAYVPNGDAAALKLNGLINIYHSLPPAYRNVGVWMINSTSVAAIRAMTNAMGAPVWVDSLAVGNPATILGRPVVEAVDMPDVANGTFPIVFGDFNSAYRIYDRVSLAVLRDPFTQAKKSLVRFHARRRVGGDVVRPEAIRKLKISVS